MMMRGERQVAGYERNIRDVFDHSVPELNQETNFGIRNQGWHRRGAYQPGIIGGTMTLALPRFLSSLCSMAVTVPSSNSTLVRLFSSLVT